MPKITVASEESLQVVQSQQGGGGGQSRWADVIHLLPNLKPGQALQITDLGIPADDKKAKQKLRFSLVNYLKNKGFREDFEVVYTIAGMAVRRRKSPLKSLPGKSSGKKTGAKGSESRIIAD